MDCPTVVKGLRPHKRPRVVMRKLLESRFGKTSDKRYHMKPRSDQRSYRCPVKQ